MNAKQALEQIAIAARAAGRTVTEKHERIEVSEGDASVIVFREHCAASSLSTDRRHVSGLVTYLGMVTDEPSAWRWFQPMTLSEALGLVS